MNFTEFTIIAKVDKIEKKEIKGHTRMDMIIVDQFDKLHYVQVRPNQFANVATTDREKWCELQVFNDCTYSEQAEKYYNNLILENIKPAA